MKNLISVFAGLAIVTAAFGQESLSQLTMTISTTGPDCYQDGSLVLNGETYLLVYLKTNAPFHGVLMDGTLADPVNNVIATRSKASKGACEFKAVQYAPSLYPSSGKWVIVLTDTRKSDGSVGGLVAKVGTSTAVAGQSGSSLSIASLSTATSTSGKSTPASIIASGNALSQADVQAPVITAIEQKGGAAKIHFRGDPKYSLNYEVQEVADLSSGAWVSVVKRIAKPAGLATQASDLPPVAPADSGNVRFFRVVIP